MPTRNTDGYSSILELQCRALSQPRENIDASVAIVGRRHAAKIAIVWDAARFLSLVGKKFAVSADPFVFFNFGTADAREHPEGFTDMARSTNHLLVVCLFLLILLSWKTSGRAAEGAPQVKSSAATNERRRVFSFDNWTVELFYGRATKNAVEEQSGTAESRTPRRTKPNRPLDPEIALQTSSRRAAALRFAERGRKFLQTGEYETALLTLEKALALDSVPYIYYYLARAHHHLNGYQESATFLDVAESRLSESREWMAEVAALKRENARALTKQARQKQAAAERVETRAKRTTTVATLSLSAVLALTAVLCFLAFAMVLSARFRRSLS
ncbi:MAG: hypothetical protein ACREQW_06575 [Candidatus Binatia bacterium]